MGNTQELLFDVWREACRHIHITESASAIARILAGQVPLAELLIRRIDVARSCLETVVVATVGGQRVSELAKTSLTTGQIEWFLAWCNQGRIFHHRAHGELPASAGEWSLLTPRGVTASTMAGPLSDRHGPAGVLMMVADPGRAFDAGHEALLEALLEPFSVAVENDGRVREMATFREAAEADRRSLLNRLGRQALGDTIIGVELGLRSVMERVELVARSDVPVLIFGETGTGKELVGRAIHTRSARHAGPFLRVNCGAIPAELIDSQLFGHERGSFTGATGTHQGWFERADRGTLFLDEIGELPLPAQVRLLRVLQDGVFERVGGQQPITVDVRIVAATHRDLSGMVRDGRFREDLWYRLAVFPIDLPPLRERVEDIPALARHFAQRAATRFGLPARDPSPDDMALLATYPWPGNVRELGAVMDRAAILGDGQRLEVATALGVQTSSVAPATAAPRAADSPAPLTRIAPLDEVVKAHIETALATTNGRIEGVDGAAIQLKVNPHTLRARMRKLGIDWAQFRRAKPDGPA